MTQIPNENDPRTNGRMYASAKTWNPFKGCGFTCTYCEPTFRRQAKRQKHLCGKCYAYEPHEHSDRLNKIPSAGIIFVAGNADICFAKPSFVREIIDAIREHNKRCPSKTYYFQSKRPQFFEQFLSEFPENVILLTTLETNRDDGYEMVSNAPKPSVRYEQFKALEYPRKVVTAEPLLDFDLQTFTKWIVSVRPEYAWIGYNSYPESVQLPDPPLAKTEGLIRKLAEAGIPVRRKEMRDE